MKGVISRMLSARGRHISFHTPGHKRRGKDITELSYSDNLASPTGVLAAAQAEIASILGADASFITTDGSSSGVYAMLHALKRAGVERLAVPISSHVSVLRGCELTGLVVVPVVQEKSGGFFRQPTQEAVAAALKGADALLLTSPDYYGFFPDFEQILPLLTRQNKPLVIDGAHGAHLHGTPLYAGNFAQMWVDGVHKSLPAMTQGAVVSAKGEWAARLKESIVYFRTTSPSYPIMESIEYAVRYPRNERIERAAQRLKRETGALDNPDWSKILLPFGEKSGAARRKLERRGVYPEFDDGNYLMFYLSPATKMRELRLLKRLVNALARGSVREDAMECGVVTGRTVALSPRDAIGRTCAVTCGLFPPCMPLVAKGERVSEEAVRRLEGALSVYGLNEGKIIVYEESDA